MAIVCLQTHRYQHLMLDWARSAGWSGLGWGSTGVLASTGVLGSTDVLASTGVLDSTGTPWDPPKDPLQALKRIDT